MILDERLRWMGFWMLDKMKGGKTREYYDQIRYAWKEGSSVEETEKRIQNLIAHAVKTTDFYKDYPETCSLEDLPVVNKDTFRQQYDRFVSSTYKDAPDNRVMCTSGSTGTPLRMIQNRDKIRHNTAGGIFLGAAAGYYIGMKEAFIRVWVNNVRKSKFQLLQENLIMMDSSRMDEKALEEMFHVIEKKKVKCLVGYSSALGELSEYIRKTGRDISRWSVEMVFSMGEALPQETYDLTKELFGFSPVRSYGNNENGFIAIQLDEDPEYTVDLYNFYPEILKLDSDEPAEPGELGRIVVTDYYNKTFPMVRYDTGDTGKMRVYYDKNGRVHAKYTEIYGRRGSLMYNTKGEPLSIHVFMNTLLKFEGTVYQAKCIQWGEKDYELLVNADRSRLDETELLAAYRHYLGEDAELRITYVDQIPIQASGKFMVCENKWDGRK